MRASARVVKAGLEAFTWVCALLRISGVEPLDGRPSSRQFSEALTVDICADLKRYMTPGEVNRWWSGR